MCRRLLCFALFVVLLGVTAGVASGQAFEQDGGPDGIVSVEAEHYDNKTVGDNGDEWIEVGPMGGFTGVAGMQAQPDNNSGSRADNYAARSPRLDFEVNFVKTGTHYVWILASGDDGNSDSCHAGLDGEEIATCSGMSGWNGDYQWSGNQMAGPPSMFEVTEVGIHTLNVWMREDGLIVDKIVLTTNPDFTLTGVEAGPPESWRGPRPIASGASPASGATDVPREVVLSWEPGALAVAHNVYFGTVFDDVNAASIANPLDVLAGEGQSANTYAPETRLEFGQTYYWRIDEVDGPPDATVHKGEVWSFTVEPFAYEVENVAATASSTETGAPGNTIDGSGLDADDLHSTDDTAMWLSATDPNGAWIQFEFDRGYKLHEMWVWNYNVIFEPVLGYGLKDVTVEFSADGMDWTVLTDVEFAQASAEDGYAHNTVVDFAGVGAKYVRLTTNSNWSPVGLTQFGLSEVRFFYLPVQAREPRPASGAADVDLDVVLGWRAGREAASHEVYVSSDRGAVVDGTALADVVTANSYDLGPLDLGLGELYFWKITEVNDAESPRSWEGDIWSFTTPEFMIVEDFESYTDDIDAGQTIYQTWIDGWENGTGSTVGYLEATNGTFGETVIVHGGTQSMPLEYNNVNTPYYSEAERTWDVPQDWTVNGIDALQVHFRGNPAGFVESSPGVITMSAAGYDIWETYDEFTFAYKPLNGNGSIVVRVDSLENTDVWAKAGVMIRQGLDADAKNAMAYVTPDGRAGWQYRQIPVGASSSTRSEPGAITLPHWLRLTREGNLITVEHSSDAATWEPMIEVANPDEPSSLEIPMSAPVFIGLALTSHSSGNVCTAEFSGASTSGGASGQWQFAKIGVDVPLNDRDDLYVALKDSAGRLGVVPHPEPDAVLQDTWQPWNIPLSEFSVAGVNLAAVKTMYIGVGDRNNPVQDGAGLLFIDDIAVGHPGLADPGDSGLVASYSLENSVEDGSGNGHDGTVVGTPAYVEGPAGYGMAMEFDGTGEQYVVLGNWNPSAGDLTVALWAKWNGLSGSYQGLIAKRDSWAADDMMWRLGAHQDTGVIRVGREGISQIESEALAEGQWEHWAFTFDGSQVVIYRNGQEVASGDFSYGTDTEASVQFGAGSGTGGNPYNGALDEIRIYDRVLSAFEIRYLAGPR